MGFLQRPAGRGNGRRERVVNPRLPEGVRLLYEDRDLLVADKPAGLLTVATETEKRRTLYAVLFDYLRHRRPPGRPFVVHRLDREASGPVVFAKPEAAKRQLQDQFKEHEAGRVYWAVTEGRIERDSFTVTSLLAEFGFNRCGSTSNPALGKRAVTHIRVLERGPDRTLVEARLETGRKHQIRVHLAEQGHPILGDPVYGRRKSPFRRLALHGVSLACAHPATGKLMTWESPAPAWFRIAGARPSHGNVLRKE
jgi:RluA family pseudouridine synthase